MHLLVEFFDSFDRRRNAEFLLALHENVGNSAIEQIHLFIEGDAKLNFTSAKFKIMNGDRRRTFNELISYCNEHLDGQICIVSNNDIIFNHTLRNVQRIDLERAFVALSRWEINYVNGAYEYRLFDNPASQDCWIFKAPIAVTEEMNFPLGMPGCDNRIARIFHDLGYRILNPAKRIVATHFHHQVQRNYSSLDRIKGPYLLIPPTGSLNGEQAVLEIDSFDNNGTPIISNSIVPAECLREELASDEPSRCSSIFAKEIERDSRGQSGQVSPARLLFDHIPKCGGTTLTNYLMRHYPPESIFVTNGYFPEESVKQFRSLSPEIRHRFELITGHETNRLLEFVHPETLAITLLRDPVERIRSHYRYVLNNPSHYLHDTVVKSGMTLSEYVSNGVSPELRNWYVTHFARMSIDEAEANADAAISRARDTIIGTYDLIGFLEDLPLFVSELGSIANLYHPFENEKLNATFKDSPELLASDDERSLIMDINYLDVEFYRLLRQEAFSRRDKDHPRR